MSLGAAGPHLQRPAGHLAQAQGPSSQTLAHSAPRPPSLADAEAPHGCRSSLLWVGSRPMGTLLCYGLDCGRCSQAVRERQQRLIARQARPSCCPYSSSSRDSSDSCRHRATASSFRPAERTFLGSRWQPVLRKRKQRRLFPQHTALNTQGAATLPRDAGPLRQAEELVKMAPVRHEASLRPPPRL